MNLLTEDHWTPASAWCPQPQWWHTDADDPESAEAEVAELIGGLIRALQPKICVETGTATGRTAAVIGRALSRNGHGRLWTIEIDGAAAMEARRFTKDLPVSVVTGDSLTWEPPEPVDFAWIDSGTAETRVREIHQWAGKFSPGAIVGVHDTSPNMGRQVLRKLAAEWFRTYRWQVLSLRTPRGVMIAQAP